MYTLILLMCLPATAALGMPESKQCWLFGDVLQLVNDVYHMHACRVTKTAGEFDDAVVGY